MAGGSFGQRLAELETGGRRGPWDWFVVSHHHADRGWTAHNRSRVRLHNHVSSRSNSKGKQSRRSLIVQRQVNRRQAVGRAKAKASRRNTDERGFSSESKSAFIGGFFLPSHLSPVIRIRLNRLPNLPQEVPLTREKRISTTKSTCIFRSSWHRNHRCRTYRRI